MPPLFSALLIPPSLLPVQVGVRLGRHLPRIIPLFLAQLGDPSNDALATPDGAELRDNCLSAFESFLLRCPAEAGPYAGAMLDAAKAFVSSTKTVCGPPTRAYILHSCRPCLTLTALICLHSCRPFLTLTARTAVRTRTRRRTGGRRVRARMTMTMQRVMMTTVGASMTTAT